jgi:hypothetical protein
MKCNGACISYWLRALSRVFGQAFEFPSLSGAATVPMLLILFGMPGVDSAEQSQSRDRHNDGKPFSPNIDDHLGLDFGQNQGIFGGQKDNNISCKFSYVNSR